VLTGVLVAGLLATGALVTSEPATTVGGTPLALDVAPAPSPIGDSMSTGRGPDLAGIRGGANRPEGRSTPAPPPPAQPSPSTERPPPAQQPGTVRLPRGGTATLVRSEVDESGTLPVPEGVGEATWWGADLAGRQGATVLAGHVNWRGVTGPFAELWQASTGTDVTVLDAAGTEHRYRISEVVTLHKDELPTRALDLFGPGGPHRLVLVTCGGEWVGGQVGYDENRVVTATPVA
jgi:hypothetical protein